MMNNQEGGDVYGAWLSDAEGQHAHDLLTAALDDLLLEEPNEGAIEHAQSTLRETLQAAGSKAVYYDLLARSPLGPIYLAMSEAGLVALDFSDSEEAFLSKIGKRTGVIPTHAPEKLTDVARQVREYLRGERAAFDVPLDLSSLTAFQRQVLQTVRQVPRGDFITYAELARRIGRPKAARAVGRALGSNPIPIIIPCHRVLASDGGLGGYSGRDGVRTKARLLYLEGAHLPPASRILNGANADHA
jgi:methylated-DNA-[protein]-cysteine S-methyltransferase